MTPKTEARAHLRKAGEFLDAADLAAASRMWNAAASAAVTSGINAKDAMCLALAGRTGKTDTHADAVSELRSVGGAAAPLATTLSRLLKLKNRSQYQAADVSAADALKAIDWARRLYDGAREMLPQG